MPSEPRAETTALRLHAGGGPVPPSTRKAPGRQAGRSDALLQESGLWLPRPLPRRRPTSDRGGAAGGPRALRPRRGPGTAAASPSQTGALTNTTYF